MRIAFFSDCYLDLTGGIVSSINAQKAALEKLGHEVYVFSSGFPRKKAELAEMSLDNIYQVPSCKLCFRGLTPVSRRPSVVEKWLEKEHPELRDFDVFYVHYESGCSIAALRLAKKYHIPSVQVMHGREDMGEQNLIPLGFRTIVAILLNWFHSWYLPHPVTVSRDNYLADNIAKAKMWTLMVNHANAADYVLTPSAHFRDKLIHYGVKKKIMVFPNGFSDEHFPENPPVKEVEPGEEIRMIWHSRVSGEKRIMPFLHALNHVRGNFRLDVYGDGNDLSRARRFAKRHNLKVFFYGNTLFNKVQNAISKAHLDILVSYNYDTFGMTLIEAEAAGVPVFFCDPDMEEIVPEGSYLMSTNETPVTMAEALNYLMIHPELIRRMSEIMLKHRDEILISKRIKLLADFFDDIIKP